ncbi:MAG: hypothetical protein Q8Q48_00745 [Candidatus Staskawiczbacteria bacterium]|nr:hypothetical protein [Candidatus Staskawiczbacteria bacterium]
MKKIFFAILMVGTLGFAGNVLAEATINSVQINGADSINVRAGEPITATVNASLTNSSAWRSTAYRFGEGSWNCVDTKDHKGVTTATETFLITAPVRAGTNGVSFEIYTNNDCTNGPDITVLSASLLTTFINIFSFGTGETWLSIVSSVLIIIVLAFAIFYIIKIIIGKKTKINSEDK